MLTFVYFEFNLDYLNFDIPLKKFNSVTAKKSRTQLFICVIYCFSKHKNKSTLYFFTCPFLK